jgi:hypothetical protein
MLPRSDNGLRPDPLAPLQQQRSESGHSPILNQNQPTLPRYSPFPFEAYRGGLVTHTAPRNDIFDAPLVATLLTDEVASELARACVLEVLREQSAAHLGGALERDLANAVMVDVLLDALHSIAAGALEDERAASLASLVAAEVVDELALDAVADALAECGRLDARDAHEIETLFSRGLEPTPASHTTGASTSRSARRLGESIQRHQSLHRRHGHHPGGHDPGDEPGATTSKNSFNHHPFHPHCHRMLDGVLLALLAHRVGTGCNRALLLRGAHRAVSDPVLASLLLSRGVALDTSAQLSRGAAATDAARRAAVRAAVTPALAAELRAAAGEHLVMLARSELAGDVYDHLDFRAQQT